MLTWDEDVTPTVSLLSSHSLPETHLAERSANHSSIFSAISKAQRKPVSHVFRTNIQPVCAMRRNTSCLDFSNGTGPMLTHQLIAQCIKPLERRVGLCHPIQGTGDTSNTLNRLLYVDVRRVLFAP